MHQCGRRGLFPRLCKDEELGMTESLRTCPICRNEVGAHWGATYSSQPESGDLAICVSCQAVLQFTEDLSLGLVDLERIDRMNRMESFRLAMAKKAAAAFRADRDSRN